MNLNQLAKEVCKREGKKIEVPIGQVKEILSIIIDIFSEEYGVDVRGEFKWDGYTETFLDFAVQRYRQRERARLKRVKKK